MKITHIKRVLAFVLALVLCCSAVPSLSTTASAASSASVASAVASRLPIVTYAMPLSGASRVYSYSNSSLSTKTTGYYIDTFSDQIVITQISSDGRAVLVTYPSSSAASGYRSRWFAADDILGLATVSIHTYTASSKSATYRMTSGGTASYGSIARNDACVLLGSRGIGERIYYPTVYPISSGTYNKVSGVRYKLALAATAPSDKLVDVTAFFAGKTVTMQSVENGKYLCADSNASGTPLRANKDQALTWETFTVSSLTSDGWVGFKAHNGKWLSAMADMTDTPVGAKYDNLLSWECFRIFKRGNDYFLKAQIKSDKWLCVRVDTPEAPVQAYANGASTWECLNIRVVNAVSSSSQSASYASHNGVNYTSILSSALSSGKIGSKEYNNRVALLNEAQKMVYVIWKSPVSFRTWRSGGGVYNSNKAMQYSGTTSTTSQFVKGQTYVGIPYAANAGYNNYNAEGWLSLISSGVSVSQLQGTVTFAGTTRYNTTFRGIDCSGFVHKAYSVINSYTYTDSNRLSCSGMLNSSDWKKISASEALPGDILLKSGHVMVYLGKTSSGKIAVFESVADGENGMSGCRYYEFSSVSGYGYYRYCGIAR